MNVLRLGNTFFFEKNAVCQFAVGKKPRFEHEQDFETQITLPETEVLISKEPALPEVGETSMFYNTCNFR